MGRHGSSPYIAQQSIMYSHETDTLSVNREKDGIDFCYYYDKGAVPAVRFLANTGETSFTKKAEFLSDVNIPTKVYGTDITSKCSFTNGSFVNLSYHGEHTINFDHIHGIDSTYDLHRGTVGSVSRCSHSIINMNSFIAKDTSIPPNIIGSLSTAGIVSWPKNVAALFYPHITHSYGSRVGSEYTWRNLILGSQLYNHSGVAHPELSGVTVPSDGLYLLDVGVAFNDTTWNDGAYCLLGIYRNPFPMVPPRIEVVDTFYADSVRGGYVYGSVVLHGTRLLHLAATTQVFGVVALKLTPTTRAAVSIEGAYSGTYLAIVKVA